MLISPIASRQPLTLFRSLREDPFKLNRCRCLSHLRSSANPQPLLDRRSQLRRRLEPDQLTPFVATNDHAQRSVTDQLSAIADLARSSPHRHNDEGIWTTFGDDTSTQFDDLVRPKSGR